MNKADILEYVSLINDLSEAHGLGLERPCELVFSALSLFSMYKGTDYWDDLRQAGFFALWYYMTHKNFENSRDTDAIGQYLKKAVQGAIRAELKALRSVVKIGQKSNISKIRRLRREGLSVFEIAEKLDMPVYEIREILAAERPMSLDSIVFESEGSEAKKMDFIPVYDDVGEFLCYDALLRLCKDETDVEILRHRRQELSLAETAERLGLSKTEVYKRLLAIFRSYPGHHAEIRFLRDERERFFARLEENPLSDRQICDELYMSAEEIKQNLLCLIYGKKGKKGQKIGRIRQAMLKVLAACKTEMDRQAVILRICGLNEVQIGEFFGTTSVPVHLRIKAIRNAMNGAPPKNREYRETCMLPGVEAFCNTERERTALGLFRAGYSVSEIGRRMGMHANSVAGKLIVIAERARGCGG